MDILLGAWGLGNGLCDHAEIKGTPYFNLNLPPMSTTHQGYVELFPFLIFDRVYMDEKAFRMLCWDGIIGFKLSGAAKHLLIELKREGILCLVDYSNELKDYKEKIELCALKLINSENLKHIYRTSRILWKNFLTSPGGEIHPNKVIELSNTHEEINIIPRINNSLFYMKRAMHDALDVSAMIFLSEKLDAGICDWQMYGPLYDHIITDYLSSIKEISAKNISFLHENLDLYLPIIENPDPGSIISLRESKIVSSFRHYLKIVQGNSKNIHFDELLDIRQVLTESYSSTFQRLHIFPIFDEKTIFTQEYLGFIQRKDLNAYLQKLEYDNQNLQSQINELKIIVEKTSKPELIDAKIGAFGFSLNLKAVIGAIVRWWDNQQKNKILKANKNV